MHERNKVVKTDSSFFPIPKKVMQSLKSSSKLFIKADVLQGFHQIELDTSCCNLFCFALEDGLYRYTRAPIGYAGSSYYFNQVIKNIWKKFPQTHVEINDLLTEPSKKRRPYKYSNKSYSDVMRKTSN